MQDLLELLLGGEKFLQGIDVVPQAAVLRRQDGGPGAGCERVDRSLREGELIAERAREAGPRACHEGILIEDCREDDNGHRA